MTDSEKEYGFRKALKRLSKFQGSGTQLISVYIPAGSQIHEMSNKLREEMSQASNIKSKQTKTNVIDALERIIHHLKVYKKPPENGIAIFSGNTSDNPSKTDIELFSIEPIQKLNIGTYRCDSKFFLGPLEEMITKKDSYGIVVLDGREATIAIVKGTNVQILHRLNSMAHAKHNAGGQSARRYERLIEESIEKYYVRVGEAMDRYFLNNVKGVIVGGPGPTKDFFMKSQTYNYQLKVLGCVDTGYTDEYGVREVLAKSEDILAEQEAIKEKKIVDQFIKEVVRGGLATYGEKQVREAILSKQADKVLVSEVLEYNVAKYTCSSCGAENYKVSKDTLPSSIQCSKCEANMAKKGEDVPLIEDIIELAKEMNIEVTVISNDTAEGAQFLVGFAGIGAFLRYRLQ
ncbi:MAG: peptide chain release factor aRF-1 [Candidatus Micrarchaeota archaeon]